MNLPKIVNTFSHPITEDEVVAAYILSFKFYVAISISVLSVFAILFGKVFFSPPQSLKESIFQLG